MKRWPKIVILVLTLLPWLNMVITMVFAAKMMLSPAPRDLGSLNFPLERELTISWLVVMSTYYLIHIFTKSRLSKQLRITWAFLVVLFNMFTMPLYWCIYIWPEKPAPREITSAAS